METYEYKVVFTDGVSIQIRALSATQATILAQAERIKRCEPYDVKTCNLIGH